MDDLSLDLLEWLRAQPRTYAETLDAWRTSCPRLTVWEDVVEAGFVERVAAPGRAWPVDSCGRRKPSVL